MGGGMMWSSPFVGAFGFLGIFLAVLAALFVFRWITGAGAPPPSALDALKSRYAKGEINQDEYRRMKTEIAER